MNLPVKFRAIIILFGIALHKLKCELSTAGYAYELVGGEERADYISHERFQVYHKCWADTTCNYVAHQKSDGKFVKLLSVKNLDSRTFYSLWRKRTEGKDES